LQPDLTPSLLALIIQAVGIGLIAVLSFFLARSIDRVYLSYWWIAWACLAAGLAALFLAFRLGSAQPVLEPCYFLGEYGFGYLLIAGCRNYATGAVLGRRHLLALIPGIFLALFLSRIHPDFSGRFITQAGILAGFFVVAFWRLQQGRRPDREGPGLRITSVALLALSLNFLHYVPVLSYSLIEEVRLLPAYSSYTSLFDLILETLLGFGTVILVMEDVHREAEDANRELRRARDRMESLARMDPLTESLNRHAFYSLVEDSRIAPGAAPGGCVVVVDIDSLKPINDALGHAAGDAVIRAVSGAIRRLVRADDLVFRWGGDEFLIVLFGVSEEETRRRLEGLDLALARLSVPGTAEPISVTVSCGIAPFSAPAVLERAIERADDTMYLRKKARRDIKV
jgi:diguanylate cyclase (GGDEF)-like protein